MSYILVAPLTWLHLCRLCLLQFKHALQELTSSWSAFWTVFTYRFVTNARAVAYVRSLVWCGFLSCWRGDIEV